MPASLEQRVAALEKQVAQLQQRTESSAPSDRAWLDDVYGAFAGDPLFEQAMKLGRDYRKSHRPRARNSKRAK